jgi:hypothetical protein
LTEIYLALGLSAPEELGNPIKRHAEPAVQLAPGGLLKVKVDGRETSYFEWLGAGLYSPERRGGAMHGRTFYLHEIRYGFSEHSLFVRVDPFREALDELTDPEFRITVGGACEICVVVKILRGKLQEYAVEKDRACLLNPQTVAAAAYDKILEVSIQKGLLDLMGQSQIRLGVALWHGGLPIDVLPARGFFEIPLGAEHSAWTI